MFIQWNNIMQPLKRAPIYSGLNNHQKIVCIAFCYFQQFTFPISHCYKMNSHTFFKHRMPGMIQKQVQTCLPLRDRYLKLAGSHNFIPFVLFEFFLTILIFPSIKTVDFYSSYLDSFQHSDNNLRQTAFTQDPCTFYRCVCHLPAGSLALWIFLWLWKFQSFFLAPEFLLTPDPRDPQKIDVYMELSNRSQILSISQNRHIYFSGFNSGFFKKQKSRPVC